jgi:hypothetical protein
MRLEMRAASLAAALLAGCATQAPAPATGGGPVPPAAQAPSAAARATPLPRTECRDEVARLQAQLASESAERRRLLRAASQREEVLRKQLDAMKSIERGILEREERTKSETR